jgi:hypothetical protein
MVRARAENLKPKWKKTNRVEMAIVSSQSYACMTILRRFTLALFVFLMLVACNAARTTPIEALRGITAGATTRFVFPTSGSNAEAYLIRPTGSGPFPLMILIHGHTFGPMGDAASVVPEAEAFARDLCYAGLAVSLPGYGATEVQPGGRSKEYLERYLEGSPGRGFSSQAAPLDRCKAIVPFWSLPWRILRRAAGQPDRRNQRGNLAVRSL